MPMTPTQIAIDTLTLFFEYRDQHGYDEADARDRAVAEVVEAEAMGVTEE